MASYMLPQMEINSDVIDQKKYDYLFTVEEVNRLVLSGIPFRDAYKKVGLDVEQDKFEPNREIDHSHSGSIGNLMLDEIKKEFDEKLRSFNSSAVQNSIDALIK